MWRYGGIVRNGAGLKELAAILAAWQAAAGEPVDRESHELRNLIICGRLLAEAALYREESRGAHFRADFPWTSEKWRRHILIGIG